jgi:Tfp pilus assembly protein PilF
MIAKERIVNGRNTLAFALVAAAAVVAGCSQTVRRPGSHIATGLLESGGTAKVTSHQAADVQFSLGRSLEESEDPSQAEAAYRKAIENDPKRSDAHARLAVVLCRKGAFEDATREFAAALRRDPQNADVLCDRGYNFYLQRRWSEAESSYREAIALDASHARSHNNLGLVFARQGNGDRAISEFLQAGCDLSDAKANLGLILAMEDHLPEAEKMYSEALAAKPGSTAASQGLAALTKAQDHRSGALAIVKASRKDDAVSRTSVELPQSPR